MGVAVQRLRIPHEASIADAATHILMALKTPGIERIILSVSLTQRLKLDISLGFTRPLSYSYSSLRSLPTPLRTATLGLLDGTLVRFFRARHPSTREVCSLHLR
jgi:hypothetical protein